MSLLLNDFEAYHELRLGKRPKIVRKVSDSDDPSSKSKPPKSRTSNIGSSASHQPLTRQSKSTEISSTKVSNSSGASGSSASTSNLNANPQDDTGDAPAAADMFKVQGQSINNVQSKSDNKKLDDDINRVENRWTATALSYPLHNNRNDHEDKYNSSPAISPAILTYSLSFIHSFIHFFMTFRHHL